MKKIMSLLAAVMLMCPACSGIAAAETLRTEVTREWIQEVYGFSDEDLEGVAVEEVAEALWWTRDEVQREFGERLFRTVIPRNVKLSEAPSFAKPVLLYDVKSKGSRCYMELAQELLAVLRQRGVI